jgi:adenylate cyclase
VIGMFVPVMGADHARKAVEAARDLLIATGHADDGGPWLPVGAGVHTGVAYVGAVGSEREVADFTAMGDAVNVTARLAGLAGEGEVLISRAAFEAAGIDLEGLADRRLELKGRSEPINVRVLSITRERG